MNAFQVNLLICSVLVQNMNSPVSSKIYSHSQISMINSHTTAKNSLHSAISKIIYMGIYTCVKYYGITYPTVINFRGIPIWATDTKTRGYKLGCKGYYVGQKSPLADLMTWKHLVFIENGGEGTENNYIQTRPYLKMERNWKASMKEIYQNKYLL